MKISTLRIAIICIYSLLIISCSSSSDKKDTNSKNIQEETTSSNTENTNMSDVAKKVVITEDMTIDNSQILPTPYDALKEAIESALSAKGKSLGTVNSDGTIYYIAQASTAVPSNRTGFINSRNIAFQKAELKAKMGLLSVAGEVVTSERNSDLVTANSTGDDPDAYEKASAFEKAAAIVDKSLDKALSHLGMSDGEIASMNKTAKEKAYSEKYYNYVSSFVAHMIKGVEVVKVIEGENGNNDYSVAVCVKYSKENQASSSLIDDLGASQEVLNSKTLKTLKNLNTEKYISMLGAQTFKDENGNKFILGFGQASVQKSDTRQSNFVDIARRKSVLNAKNNIKNLLAEDIVGKEISEDIEKITRYKNESEDNIYTENNFTQLIESKRSSVKMATLDVKTWDGVHPTSGSRVVGTIVILTEANNEVFNPAPTNSKNKDGKTKRSDFLESEELPGSDL